MIEATRIAEVLGGKSVLHCDIQSLGELASMVRHGLPKGSLRIVVSRLRADADITSQLMYRIVPKTTYKWRTARLNPAESERTARLACVIAMAEYVWDDGEAAR